MNPARFAKLRAVVQYVKKFIVANLLALSVLAITAAEWRLTRNAEHAGRLATMKIAAVGILAPLGKALRAKLCVSEAEGRIAQWFSSGNQLPAPRPIRAKKKHKRK